MSLLVDRLYRFGEFTLDADQRVLLREGRPLPLAPKVFDTLLILVEHSGRIVAKEELMSLLWPDTFVEEANLTFNIQQLRKSLQDNFRKPAYIETVARRGYRFIADVQEVPGDAVDTGDALSESLQTSDARSSLPGDETGTRRTAGLTGAEARGVPAQNLGASPSAVAPSTLANKRTAALVATIVLVVGSLGLLSWSLSRNSSRLSENRRVDGASSFASPIRIEKLTLTGQSRLAAISPDGKYIAYTRAIDKRAAIWVRQLATNTNVEIVPGTGLVYGLSFANSGEYLYFVRGDPTALFRVSLLGGVPTRIVENVEARFSVSDDDRQIVFVRRIVDRDGHQQFSLVTASLDGGGERTLLARDYPDKLDAPVWSPDNQSVLYAYGSSEGGSRSMGIAEVLLKDGSVRNLSSDSFFNIGKMAWTHQKRALILAARKNAQDNKELWLVSYPGMEISPITEGLSPYVDVSIASTEDKAVASQATRISDLWVGSSRQPRNLKRITQAIDEFCWTPSGRLLYQSTASGNRDLWTTQPDGAEQRQLTNDPAVDCTPAVTPDNRYIVFTSNRTGALQLWRMNIDGDNQIQLTDGASKNYPAISTDGRWVLYNTTDDWRLWKVPIEGGAPVRLTEYPASFPSVSPDGKMVACIARSEPRRELSILIVPIEGGGPLKRIDVNDMGFSNDRIRWTPDGKFLLYAAERDGPTFIVKQPVEGGRSEEILNFDAGVIFDFGYSFNGQLFAVTRGEWQHDIVLIDGLNRE